MGIIYTCKKCTNHSLRFLLFRFSEGRLYFCCSFFTFGNIVPGGGRGQPVEGRRSRFPTPIPSPTQCGQVQVAESRIIGGETVQVGSAGRRRCWNKDCFSTLNYLSTIYYLSNQNVFSICYNTSVMQWIKVLSIAISNLCDTCISSLSLIETNIYSLIPCSNIP